MIREHEKFWAFIALLVAIISISLPSIIWELDESKINLADKTIVGLVGVLGTVAGALFGRATEKLAEAAVVTAQTAAATQAANAAPQQVEVVNTPEAPVPTEAILPHVEQG